MSRQFGTSGVIFVTPVDSVTIPAWETGPIPFADGGVVATADVRSAYFNDPSSQALDGSDRVHRWVAHEIPDLLDQISNELGDYSSEAERSATQRSEALLGVLAVVSLPIGAAELTHALGVHEWTWNALALAIAMLLVILILLTRPGRTLVRLWLLVGHQESRAKKP